MASIFRIKDAIPTAALPASDTAFPQFISGNNVLQTGTNNIGGVIYPVISLLNAGWIESTGGDFQFYLDGVTPIIARNEPSPQQAAGYLSGYIDLSK